MSEPMSNDEFDRYLTLLASFLKLRGVQRAAIDDELRSHLEDRVAALTARGMDLHHAISQALAEFGDAAALAAGFSEAIRIRRKRWIMRAAIGSLCSALLAAGLVISYWPSGGGERQPFAIAQSSTAPADAAPPTAAIDSATATPGWIEAADDGAAEKLKLLVDAEFVETPLANLLDSYHKQTGLQFHLDRRALDDVGVTGESPVTLRLKRVPLEMVLRSVFRDLDLACYIDNGVVLVTTPDVANERVIPRVYDIFDLIENAATRPLHEHRVRELIALLQTTIAPTTWDTVGGNAHVEAFGNTLVVSQTWHVHQAIEKLLSDLRTLGVSPAEQAATARIRNALNSPTVINFVDTPLTDVVDYLRDKHQIEIQLDRKALTDVGVSTDTPVTMSLRGVSLQSALRLMLHEIDLTYMIRDEVLYITTPDEAAREPANAQTAVAEPVIPASAEPQAKALEVRRVAERRVQKALELPTRAPGGDTLVQVTDGLAAFHIIDITLDPKGLVDAGISLQTSVTVWPSPGESLSSYLNRMLPPLGLTYTVRDGALVITTPERAGKDDMIKAAAKKGDGKAAPSADKPKEEHHDKL